MKFVFKSLITCLFIAMSSSLAMATHLIGSEMYYQDLGNGEYLVTLKVYRECGPANTNDTWFDYIITLGVFNSITGEQTDQYGIILDESTVQNVPVIMTNPCGTPPPDLCIEEATYTQIITLDSSDTGHDVIWQRCCRNPTINNLQNSGGLDNPGMTTTIHIPGTNALSTDEQNSSPVFQEFPPVALCANYEFYFDHFAIDPDGDELVYSFCAPYNGGGPGPGSGPNSPIPVPPVGPPYNDVPYAAGFSASYPIASDPAFEIDSETGFITGTPTMPGQYAMGICVEEYRNGVSLGRVIRDFQFNVTLCQASIISAITPQQPEQYCIGETMSFTNASVNADEFQWNFGVNGILSDVTTEFEPTYTFPDTGVYEVTLIANPTWPCADTSTQIFEVYEPLNPTIEIDFECLDETETFHFNATGNLNNEATYDWDFVNGTPNISTGQSFQNVHFNNAENWTVNLTVNNHGCTSETSLDFDAPPDPIASIEEQVVYCQGFTYDFINNSEYSESYEWDFGTNLSNNISNEFEPVFYFPGTGTYNVTLTAFAPFTCPDISIEPFTIFTPEPINITTLPIDCIEPDGSITLGVTPISGHAPFTFSWDTSPDDTLSTFVYNTNFNPGTATVTVTDVCDTEFEIEVSWEILDDFIGEDDLICIGLAETIPTTGGTGGFSEINTEIEDSNGEMVWVSLIGASLDTSLISFNDDINDITGLYSGIYFTGTNSTGSIEVQLIDGCGNITYSTIEVQECNLEFPNIFTPNSDGDNEQFQIQGLQRFPGSQLTIFNRWGTQVFYDSNYKGGWRGKSNEGQDLSEGVYFFQLTIAYNGTEPLGYEGDVNVDYSVIGQVTFSGFVHIAR